MTQQKTKTFKQTKNNSSEDPLIGKVDAAEILGMSVASLNKLIAEREIPFYKYSANPRAKGARVRFKRAEVLRFRESYRINAV